MKGEKEGTVTLWKSVIAHPFTPKLLMDALINAFRNADSSVVIPIFVAALGLFRRVSERGNMLPMMREQLRRDNNDNGLINDEKAERTEHTNRQLLNLHANAITC